MCCTVTIYVFFSTIYAFSTAKTINRGSDTRLVYSLVYVIVLDTHAVLRLSLTKVHHILEVERSR